MNSLDRYLKTIKKEPVDHLARVPIFMQYAAEYIGSNYGAFASDYKVLVESNIRCIEDFGFEQLSAISDPYRETQGFGAEIEYLPDAVPRCTCLPMKGTKNLNLLKKPDPYSSERMLDRVNAIRSFKENYDGEYSIMGWIEGPAAEAADVYGISEFLTEIMLDEPFIIKLMDRCVDTAIDFARAQLEAGADTIGIGDAIASQISPFTYEALIQPREKIMIDAIKEMGGIVRLHICGNITHLLPGISDLNIDILDVDHLVDMKKVREVIGNEVVLSGNIDPVSGVQKGTPQSIRETMLRTYKEAGNPYMINAGCEIPAGTPVENIMALCKPVKWLEENNV